MNKIFLAFPSYQVKLKSRIKLLGKFEFWNLDKIKKDEEFIKLIKAKIKPHNKNIKNNYFFGKTIDDFKKVYKKANWGILLPTYVKENYHLGSEDLFILNLYSDLFLKPIFCVNRHGIHFINPNVDDLIRAQYHSHDKLFTNNKLIKFYKTLMPEVVNMDWHADKVSSWTREDWRIYVVKTLFNDLEKYQRSKYITTWQKECVDLVNFYETLLSRFKNDNGKYKIIQRIEILLGNYYKNDFAKIRQELVKLFDYRNEFIHGSFFDRLLKETQKKAKDGNNNLTTNIDFAFLERQTLIAKRVLILFFCIRKKFYKNKPTNSVPQIIHKSIMDIQLRLKIQKYIKQTLDLLPSLKSNRVFKN